MKLTHTDARASFVYFDLKRPHDMVAAAMRSRGVVVGRLFEPYATWVRITIGLPEENRVAQRKLREVLQTTSAQAV